MAFPILMSAGKVQYFCHLPLLSVHYNKKEALNSVLMSEHIKIAFNLDNQAKLKPVLSDSHS